MKLNAYAKVNLGLDIVRKNEQGYHDLKSIFVPITLHDQIMIHPFREDQFRVYPKFFIHPEKNTILKMIDVCRKRFNFKEHFSITLHKHIPSQAGIGGGSADAAAVLNYLIDFYGWDLSVQEKIEIAKEVGADVPFCVFNQPALVEGIGDHLQFFDFKSTTHVVLVQAKKGVSTAKAFAGLDYPNLKHPNIDDLKEALIQEDYQGFTQHLGNSFEDVAIQLVPQIKAIKDQLIECGCDATQMSGSGSVVMGFSQDEAVIDKCVQYFRGKVRFVRKTSLMVKASDNLLK